MHTIDLNRIRLFARVVEAGSFTAAARAAGLPKSSVSRAIAALERDLAVRLIQRTTRRLQPTEAGRAYYESVSRALAGIDEATAAVSELQDTPRGTVRLTAPTDLGDRLLAPILVGFAARYLERRGAPRTVAALAEHECVLFQSSSGQAVWKLVGPRGAETVEVRGAISADDHHMVREAAAAGQGLALLPIVACAGRDDASELRRVLPRHAAEGPPLHLVYPSARLVPKRVALLRDQILQEMPQRLKP